MGRLEECLRLDLPKRIDCLTRIIYRQNSDLRVLLNLSDNTNHSTRKCLSRIMENLEMCDAIYYCLNEMILRLDKEEMDFNQLSDMNRIFLGLERAYYKIKI